MTTKRRILLGLGSVALLAVVGYMVLWLTAPRHQINEESIKLIRPGMRQAEVETILGAPPGNYSGGIIAHDFPPPPHRREDWVGDNWAVEVFFDSSNKVVYSNGTNHMLPRETTLVRIRRWLGL